MDYRNGKEKKSFGASPDDFEFAENFTNAAREMYAAENPNPERAGCFTSETLRQTANSEKLPDDSVMNHLFECSECFREYRRVLESSKNSAAPEKFLWMNLFNSPFLKPTFVGAALILFSGLTFLFIRLWWEKQPVETAKNVETVNQPVNPSNSDIFQNKNRTANNQTITNEAVESPEKRTNLNSQKSPKKTDAKRIADNAPSDEIAALNLVLNESNTLRHTAGGKNGADSRLVLPARRVNLNVKLPNGFADGKYSLRIIDAFGKILIEQQSAVRKGKLSENLNLQNLKETADKICLQKGDEIPDCFDVKIER